MTISWTIGNMTHIIDDGGVVSAEWRATATSGIYSVTKYDRETFTPNPSSPSFVPYADLTESDVLRWCYEQIDKDAIETSLTAEIDVLENPTEASGLPLVEADGG